MKVQLGVVGAGYISRFHFRAYQKNSTDVRIVADLNEEAARAAAAPFNAAVASDWQAVIDNPDVNTVVILSPSSTHATVVRAALEAGKHVICEKTLSLSASESFALGKLAEEKGLLRFTSYMKRFFPAVQIAKSILPRLGFITSVYCRTYQGVGRADLYTGEIIHPWLTEADGTSRITKLSGGGILVCGGSHIFDLLLYLVGKPAGVYAHQLLREESDVDMVTHAMFDYDNDCTAHFEGNWHPHDRIGYQRDGWDEGFEINGTGGRLLLNTPLWNGSEHLSPQLRFYNAEDGTWTDYGTVPVCPFEEAEKYFCEQIVKQEQGDYDRYVGYRVDQLLESTQLSATENMRIPIPWQDV